MAAATASWAGQNGSPRSRRSRSRAVSSSRRRGMSGESPAAGDAGELVRRRDVDAVGSVEEPGSAPRFAGAPVLPDDATAAGVDDDHAVISIVVDEDVAVRERQREGRLRQRGPAGGGGPPAQGSVLVERFDGARDRVFGAQIETPAD